MSQKHYSTDDKLLLIALVTEHEEVVENKKTDAVGNSEKDAAWNIITRRFNEDAEFKRNTASLRECWKRIIKQRARKNASQLKQQTLATGGGVNTAQLTTVDSKVLEIIHSWSVEGLGNIFDSDAENACPNQPVVDDMGKEGLINKWEKWTPQKLKTALSNRLRNAIADASQSSTSTNITHSSRQSKPAARLLSLKIEAFELMKKSLTKNELLEKEYLKTKLEREKLQLEILKASYSGINKRIHNESSYDKINKKVKVSGHDMMEKDIFDHDKREENVADHDEALCISSDSDQRLYSSDIYIF